MRVKVACQPLVNDRLDRSEMRWVVEGAQATLMLKSIKVSNAWNDSHKIRHPTCHTVT
jgi:hypothetical protein